MSATKGDKPDAGAFIALSVGLMVVVCAGVLVWGMVVDAWESNNPWIYVPGGMVLVLGYAIYTVYRLGFSAKSANYCAALRAAKTAKKTPPA